MKHYFSSKISLIFTALIGLCGQAQANCGGCDPHINVGLSIPSYSFDIEVTPLYLLPMSDGLAYAAKTTALSETTPNWSVYDVKPQYHFGFDIGFRTIFPNTSSNLKLNWEHLYAKDSNSIKANGTNTVGPLFEISPALTPYKNAKSSLAFHYDSVNLNYGIFVNFGSSIRSNLFVGLNASRISQGQLSGFADVLGTTQRVIWNSASFAGVGPQIGAEMNYQMYEGLQIVSQASGAILVGKCTNHHANFKSYSPLLGTLTPPLTQPNKQKISTGNRTQTVPALGGRLGLNYSFAFCDGFIFDLAVGYEARVYFNAIQTMEMSNEIDNLTATTSATGVFAQNFQRHRSHFSVAGPYLTFDFGF